MVKSSIVLIIIGFSNIRNRINIQHEYKCMVLLLPDFIFERAVSTNILITIKINNTIIFKRLEKPVLF